MNEASVRGRSLEGIQEVVTAFPTGSGLRSRTPFREREMAYPCSDSICGLNQGLFFFFFLAEEESVALCHGDITHLCALERLCPRGEAGLLGVPVCACTVVYTQGHVCACMHLLSRKLTKEGLGDAITSHGNRFFHGLKVTSTLTMRFSA